MQIPPKIKSFYFSIARGKIKNKIKKNAVKQWFISKKDKKCMKMKKYATFPLAENLV